MDSLFTSNILQCTFCHILATLETNKKIIPEYNSPKTQHCPRPTTNKKVIQLSIFHSNTHAHFKSQHTKALKICKRNLNEREAQNEEESTTSSTKKTNQFKKPQKIAFCLRRKIKQKTKLPCTHSGENSEGIFL